MRTLNRLFLIGRLGQDPEPRTSKSGTTWCTFSLATNRARKEADGRWSEEADWHAVRVFGTQAERCLQFLRRGSMVNIEGSVTYDKWTDDEGRRRITARILADRVNFLGDLKRSGPVDEVEADAEVDALSALALAEVELEPAMTAEA